LHFDANRYWPPEKEALLLKAGFHHDSGQAANAWKQWRAMQDFDDAPWPQLRITASVGRRLRNIVEDDLTARIGGFRKFVWTAGATRIAKATPFLRALTSEGITPMLLKGGARIVTDPNSLAERYFSDIDILIRPEDWKTACRVVARDGYKNVWNLSQEMLEGRFRNTHHSIGIRVADQMDVDLHQSSLLMNRQKAADDAMWERSLPGKLGDLPMRLPHPSDRLAIIFGHAFLYMAERNYEWVGDALSSIASPGFDWALFQSITEKRELNVPAAAGLKYLKEELGANLPLEPLKRLEDNIREPFISEFEAYYSLSNFETTDAEQSQKILEAELKRIRNLNSAEKSESTVSVDTSWQKARRAERRNGYAIEVPPEAAQSGLATLEIRYRVFRPWRAAALALRTFDYFCVEIGRWKLPGIFPALWKTHQIRIDVPGALIDGREVPELGVVALSAGNRITRNFLAAVSYRWRIPPVRDETEH